MTPADALAIVKAAEARQQMRNRAMRRLRKRQERDAQIAARSVTSSQGLGLAHTVRRIFKIRRKRDGRFTPPYHFVSLESMKVNLRWQVKHQGARLEDLEVVEFELVERSTMTAKTALRKRTSGAR